MRFYLVIFGILFYALTVHGMARVAAVDIPVCTEATVIPNAAGIALPIIRES